MMVRWKEQLSTGVWWQEKQHRELFARFAKLVAAMEHGRGREEVDELYEFMENYLGRHFQAEEAAMERIGYSGKRAHAAEHRKLLEEITALRAEFETGARLSLVLKVQRRIIDWFMNHIGNMDKSLGSYLRAEELKHQQVVVNC
ncbi:MAG: hemerythrin family protein [Deltaproteobacteria bacterium]|nr:hemerythrin family protein [Deltaproteobacteria bacterium]MBZ0219560.1 bacteriohemerythrin [Deltaproteobacteria bacterium]